MSLPGQYAEIARYPRPMQLSARVAGGLTVTPSRGASVALGSQIGGLGADDKRINGRVPWPF